MLKTDVAIVGAGFAGLAAAVRLKALDVEAVVLEARDRVGGRVVNQALDGGGAVEGGGQWLGPGQTRMYHLAKTYGIATYPTYDIGKTVALIGDRRYEFTGDLPRMNPLVLADFARSFWKIERLAKGVDIQQPWSHLRAANLDSMTVADWLKRHMRSERARSILRLFIGAVFACEPEELSMLWFLFYIKAGNSFDTLVRTTRGAQQDRVVGGSQRIAQAMEEELAGSVLLSQPVTAIASRAAGVELSGESFVVRAKRAILSVPPGVMGRIRFDPALPSRHAGLLASMPHGAVIKTNVVYERPFWRDRGLNGQAGSPELPVAFTFDNSIPGSTEGILLAFAEGSAARELMTLDPASRKTVVVDCLVRFFGPQAAEPLEFHELDWTAEEWTRGCYGARMAPGVMSNYGQALRESVGPIHFAGTETALEWVGYMEGAVESGYRVAEDVAKLLRKERSPIAGR